MEEFVLLSRAISVFIVVAIATSAIFEIKGIIRDVITTLLLLIAIMNYLAVYYVSVERAVKVHLYPLVVVEEYGNYGALYPDISQISLLTILLLWRREIARRIRGLRYFVDTLTQRIKNAL
ncbi:MAG: hypothetical protein ACO2OR_01625 [Desulfurococcaceae archaeon]